MLYRMRFILPLLLLCSIARAGDGYQRFVCIDDPRLTVTLLTKLIASPADEEYVGWEFDNHTKQPLTVSNAHYRLDQVVKSDRATGKAISKGSMASGGSYDLFRRDGDPVPPGPYDDIPPGVSRHMNYASVYSLTITGFPRQGAWTLAGQAHIQITLADKTNLATPQDGVPFHFDLLAADDIAVAAMSTQLKRRLASPTDPFGDAYALSTLFEVDAVATSVDITTLLAGLKRAHFVSSGAIVKYIDRVHFTDEQTIAFWIDAVNRDDYNLLREIEPATKVRSEKLIEPLVACIERWEHSAGYFALRILHRQRDLMPDRAAVAKRVGPLVLKQSPWLERGETDFEKHIVWQEQMDNLALTGDPAMTKYFLPYLDCTDVVINARQISLMNSGVSTRACDYAYNELLVLLDRPSEPLTMFTDRTDPAKEYARRDALIEKLKADLSAHH